MELVAEKYKQTALGLIPYDWELFILGDLLNGIADVNHYMPKTETNGIPYVMTGDLKELVSDIDFENCKKINLEDYKELSKKVKNLKGDIILARYATIGTVSYVNIDFEFIVSYSCVTVKPNTSKLKSLFFFYYFKSNLFKLEVRNIVNANIQDNVGIGDLYKMQIPLPPTIEEQTIIATALSDADALISSLEKLIVKKRNIKQGAMQKLLQPKEGWDVKKLGEVVNIRKGQIITESTTVTGNVPVIAGGKSPAYFHNKANRFGKTITISGSGASAGYVAFHNYPIFASDCSTIEEHKDYSIEYVFYLLQLLQDKIYKMQTGGAQPHIHPSDLNPIKVSFPNKEKQVEIATILLDMDAEINALETKLEKYKKVKLGMMQNLLTGKIRLI